MPDAVKGGLFVGAAVAAGILAGLLVPRLVVAEDAQRPQRAHAAPSLPTMPSVVGRPLDEADLALRRRGIDYVTNAPDVVERVVPMVLEVCETEPAEGAAVRGSARVRAALVGTCAI
jgi:hypothetical protein